MHPCDAKMTWTGVPAGRNQSVRFTELWDGEESMPLVAGAAHVIAQLQRSFPGRKIVPSSLE